MAKRSVFHILFVFPYTSQLNRENQLYPLNSNKWNSLSINEYSLIISPNSFTYSMCGRVWTDYK